MFRARYTAVIVAAALAAAWPATARASDGWLWPVDGEVVLAYGRTYESAAGKTCTHGGIDIGSEPGASVRSCVSGQVAFAGRVPAGEGAQAFAVTVLTSDGLRISYLPLRSLSIHNGENVAAGDTLGKLDERGDASSAQTHLHVGVRRGGTQLDPATFLRSGTSAPPAAAVEPPVAKGTGPGLPTHSNTVVPAASAPSAVRAPHRAPVEAGAADPVPAPVTTLEQAIGSATRASSGMVAGAPALTRVRELAESPVLNVSQVLSDVRSGRGWLVGLLTKLGIAAVAGACLLPVLRDARGVGVARTAQVALARRTVR
jgi:hypothetical protein